MGASKLVVSGSLDVHLSADRIRWRPGSRSGGQQICDGILGIQIVLNTLWTPVFFGLRHLRASIAIMACLWCAVLGATITHWQLDTWAGLAFIPYLVWVSVAAALNLSMVRLNPDQKPLDMANL
jgi:tryptophan-rich sensory protein